MGFRYTRCSAQHKYDFDMRVSATDMVDRSLPIRGNASQNFETKFRLTRNAILNDEYYERRKLAALDRSVDIFIACATAGGCRSRHHRLFESQLSARG